eukprot:CAMPEP_0170614308 /NCGR_PEP_ID=MMETSP0224-20130122/24729_1 /TAXON_ID=285029 /ORGANISM="Togula jolla, Strain CCCM 725" /LENGTH=565 /DNA_ID=CAMNT_0010939953 /DNA_START=64 /DNA_END=1761 /DNA_ORIENTATION=+
MASLTEPFVPDAETPEFAGEDGETGIGAGSPRWSRRVRLVAFTVAVAPALLFCLAGGLAGSEDPEVLMDSMDSMDSVGDVVLAETSKPCKPFCHKASHDNLPWDKKCGWENCRGCSECKTLPSLPTEAKTPHDFMPCEGSVMTTESLTEGDYDDIVKAIHDALDQLDSSCTPDSCPQADISGCILRMAGHDFMDYHGDSGLGGSDGCTNVKDEDNAGLEGCLVAGTEYGFELYSFYKRFCTKVSLADFLVIAAEAAMSFTRNVYLQEFPDRAMMDFKSQFQFGRTTAATCDYASHMLPNPENCDDVTRVFVDNLGLKWSQATALMGVHTLGRASPDNSGYDGWWSDPENSRRFNNNYYISLMAKGWLPERAINGNPKKNQWQIGDVGFDPKVKGKQMMLDTDMCLAFSAGMFHYKKLAAVKDDCCTWTFALNLAEGAIDKYNDGMFCGEKDEAKVKLWESLPKGTSVKDRIRLWGIWENQTGHGAFATFADMRGQCCKGNRYFTGEYKGYKDCGGVSHPTGFAAKSVELFANDEDAWVKEFMVSWRRATGAGFEGKLAKLKPTVV